MHLATALTLAASFALPQDTAETKRAIAIVKKVEGQLTIDKAGRVIALNL